jgi:hypothetical protein
MKQPPSFARWTDEDKPQLLSVMSDDVNIMDTQYGRRVALQERKLEVTLEGMTQGKKGCTQEEIGRNVDGFKLTMAIQNSHKNQHSK